ncbi:MAG: hypothetical protein NTW21_00980, partial [Verrucomicrobia bacterium]|nr:hypothetical protein [Verrucomicrobiota bacterium]
MKTNKTLKAICAGAFALALFVSAARAAITYDNKSSASQGAGASIAWSHPVGTGADRMLVVGIATESTANVTV